MQERGRKTDAGEYASDGSETGTNRRPYVLSFGWPGQAPSLFITQQVLLSFLSKDVLPGRTWTNASSDLLDG